MKKSLKKNILITAAAAVAVTLAVVLTAGCVGEVDHDILWKYTDDAGTIVRYISLSDDGTGTYTEYKKVTAESGYAEYEVSVDSTFSWTKEADGTVKTLNADGTNRVFTMDKKRGLLTSSSGKVYQQVPSALSGLASLVSIEGTSKENPASAGTSEPGN